MLKRRSKPEPENRAIDFASCPAKTFINPAGETVLGRNVFNHCEIVGHVAREIINRLAENLSQVLFPEGAELVAASHDIGKVSPTFYNKIMRACNLMQLPNANPDLEKRWGGHAGVSQLAAIHLNLPQYVAEILGQHHGFSPMLSGMRANDDIFGGLAWQEERKQLVIALREVLGVSWPRIDCIAQARAIAGLTSVADWIGSGQHFEDPTASWESSISRALDEAGFVPIKCKKKLSFKDVFGFFPREAQSLFIDSVVSPGVYVLEAPMGLGKTEAALYAAYKMLDSNQARGVYFALPTQLTSNKIFERFQNFLNKILSDDCSHRSLLLHANAWLFQTEMGEEGRPGGAWFNQSKRGLLAPFAVGTIDQALMAAMNVKHGFVRAFGLAGKVVILDEVHTYDAYTSTLLDALIALLRSLQCTVIILSATLNQERRAQLIGRSTSSTNYPLITASPSGHRKCVSEVPVPIAESKDYKVVLCREVSSAIEEALKRAELGQQVLWIENTVRESQQRYLDIAARALSLGLECGLLHSRYTTRDRQKLEMKWVNLFGKSGWKDRNSTGRILIGTQILEQSLDIDADFMITRFAPTDMLLQRLGRLWRHDEAPRNSTAQPEAWFLAPIFETAVDNPEEGFGASAFVYNSYILCRSLQVWNNISCVNLPHDIRGLIENTYRSRNECGSMSRWLYELDYGKRGKKGRIALQQLALVGLSEGGTTLPESKAQTRYSEQETYEVLLLKRLVSDSEKQVTRLTLLDGTVREIPYSRHKLTNIEWRQLTALLMQYIVVVPEAEKPQNIAVDKLKRYGFHHCFYLGSMDWAEDECVLRVALVSETDQLKGIDDGQAHTQCRLEYRVDLGYRMIKC